jgi:hypothetical protein
MLLKAKQPVVTVELNEKASGSVPPISGLMSAVLGSILSIAAFSAVSTQAKSDFPAITVESLAAMFVEPCPSFHNFAPARITLWHRTSNTV